MNERAESRVAESGQFERRSGIGRQLVDHHAIQPLALRFTEWRADHVQDQLAQQRTSASR